MEPVEASGDESSRRQRPFERAGMTGCLIVAVIPIVAVIGLVSCIAASLLQSQCHLPMWLGIPLGLAVGVLFIALIASAGNRTLMELSITCAIIALTAAMLLPVFMQSREKARLRRQKAAHSVRGTTAVAHPAGPPTSTTHGTRW
jgi:hypothetical protein